GSELRAELVPQDLRSHFLQPAVRQIAKLERPEGGADEPAHLEPQMLTDPLDLAVLAVPDREGQPTVAALLLIENRLDRTIADIADHDAVLQPRERRRIRYAMDPDAITAQPAGRRQFEQPPQPPVGRDQQ